MQAATYPENVTACKRFNCENESYSSATIATDPR